MPSKYNASVSLDKHTFEIWENLPRGDRSKRVRDAMTISEIVFHKEIEVKHKESRIKHLERVIYDLGIFGLDEKMKEILEDEIKIIELRRGLK
jgi:hypothetical protein